MADSECSTSGKSPAFQFYPKDFLTDENVRVMSLQERGAYITLICLCWLEGSVPADVARLARLCGSPVAAFRRLWPALAPCFRASSCEPERLIHPRLERERQKQREFRDGQSERGKLGADARWHKYGGAMPTPSGNNGSATISPMANHGSSSAISNLRSTSPEKSVSDELAERAGRFLERYASLYQQHRKGAHYLGKPALDFQEALMLCETWPDERLDKLAIVFLTTDHHFAEGGSRTIAQFRSMASWCDSRLCEAGIV